MAKIALELKKALAEKARTGDPGQATSRVLAKGKGWEVADVLCTSGPQDRKFEEQHSQVSIAIVTSGTFQYRTSLASLRKNSSRQELMFPGAFLLGNAGSCFECGHDHGTGDRCLSFHYSAECFEELAVSLGVSPTPDSFAIPRLPPLRLTTSLVAKAVTGLSTPAALDWEMLALDVAVTSLELANGLASNTTKISCQTEARIAKALRIMEAQSGEKVRLEKLAEEVGLSRFHFLRSFRNLTGLTPHQYLIRLRLREVAARLSSETVTILFAAMDAGFEDVSNFNRTFKEEFGVSPRDYRRKALL